MVWDWEMHDAAVNPLVAARLPVMAGLLDGRPLVADRGVSTRAGPR